MFPVKSGAPQHMFPVMFGAPQHMFKVKSGAPQHMLPVMFGAPQHMFFRSKIVTQWRATCAYFCNFRLRGYYSTIKVSCTRIHKSCANPDPELFWWKRKRFDKKHKTTYNHKIIELKRCKVCKDLFNYSRIWIWVSNLKLIIPDSQHWGFTSCLWISVLRITSVYHQ